jgi:hypothetical protein
VSVSETISRRRRKIACAFLFLQFFCLTGICVHDTLWHIGHGYTGLPRTWETPAQKLSILTGALLGQNGDHSNPLSRALDSYLHVAGLEKGYSYFAPGVPNSYKIVFEVQYPDGHVEYELPSVSGAGAGMRLVSLLDRIGRTDFDPLRRALVKMMARAIGQEHPDAIGVRAVFGYIEEPNRFETAQGKTEAYKFLHAYEFSFAHDPAR